MKKFLIIVLLAITSLEVDAQPSRRPLPNQFRDYVDFRMQQERPKVEHKDGKVIITMSEEQFKHMQQMRMQRHNSDYVAVHNSRYIVIRQQVCSKCERRHKRHPRHK